MNYFLESIPSSTKAIAMASSQSPPESFRVLCESEQAVRDILARIQKEIPDDLRAALWGKESTWQLHRCTNDEPAETRKSCEYVPLK